MTLAIICKSHVETQGPGPSKLSKTPVGDIIGACVNTAALITAAYKLYSMLQITCQTQATSQRL